MGGICAHRNFLYTGRVHILDKNFDYYFSWKVYVFVEASGGMEVFMDIPVNYFNYPDLAELSGKALQALVIQMKKVILDAEDPKQQREFCDRLINTAIENNRAGLDVITGEPINFRAFDLLKKSEFVETKKVQLLKLMQGVRRSTLSEARKSGTNPFNSAPLRRTLINDDLNTIDSYLRSNKISTGFYGKLRAPTLSRKNFIYFNNICSAEKKYLQEALDDCVKQLELRGVKTHYLDRVSYEFGKGELKAKCNNVFVQAKKNFEGGRSMMGQALTNRSWITIYRKKEASYLPGVPQMNPKR